MEENQEKLFYQMALAKIEGIGKKLARRLLQQFGNAQSIFQASSRQLSSIEGLGQKRVESIRKGPDALLIQKEINFLNRNFVQPLFFTDDAYPCLLRECPDAPLMLFYKGNVALNEMHMVSIIGTRNHSEYGKRVTEELVAGLQPYNVCIVSGLAYGIDIIAHRAALQKGISTIGVVAHGLDRVYPAAHASIAKEMMCHGGLITEHWSGEEAERQHFPMRNRIVAGLSEVVVVTETDVRGGAMITARLAAGYNREVVAFPGRTVDERSRGCNYLIRTNIAQLGESGAELAEMMNWKNTTQPSVQPKLFPQLSGEEQNLMTLLQNCSKVHIDELQLKTGEEQEKLASLLLGLEMQNAIRTFPGKRYSMV